MLGNPVLDEGMGQFGERNGVENLVD